MMTMTQAFPAHKLDSYIEDISRLKPETQQIPFCASAWNIDSLRSPFNQLRDKTKILTRDHISRRDVIETGVLANRGEIKLEAFFLCVMMWGYGTVGYGRWRTEKMFATGKLTTTLQAIFEKIKTGNLCDAYQLSLIDQCGPPFFTKFLYFAGKTCERKLLPLILDSRVAASLAKCNGGGFDAAHYFRSNAAGRYPRGYVDYCHDMNSWASERGFLADQLELFLFCPPVGF